MKVKIKKLHPKAVIPEQGSYLAGGWDCTCTEIIIISESEIHCKLGFALQPPSGYKITIVPRSSITKTNWIIQNSPCLFDEDFTGEYLVKFKCIPNGIIHNSQLVDVGTYSSKLSIQSETQFAYDGFPYSVGDRCCQMYLEEVIPIEFEEVDELMMTERGSGSYGSTGK